VDALMERWALEALKADKDFSKLLYEIAEGNALRYLASKITVVSYQDEVIKLLQSGQVTPEDVKEVFKNDALPILIAAGFGAAALGATEGPGDPAADAESDPPATA